VLAPRALGLLASSSAKRLARSVQLIAELETAVGEAGAHALAEKHPWTAHFPSQGLSLIPLVMEAAAHVDALKCSAAEIGSAVALGDIGEDQEPLQAQTQAQIQGLSINNSEATAGGVTDKDRSCGSTQSRVFSCEDGLAGAAGGVPGWRRPAQRAGAADAVRRVLALEALAALRLLALREAQQAARVHQGEGGAPGARPGKGTALLRSTWRAPWPGWVQRGKTVLVRQRETVLVSQGETVLLKQGGQ